MKIFYFGPSHHKIRRNLLLGFEKLGIEITKKVNDCDIIYSPSTYVDPIKFPKKKIIYGPQFAVLPSGLTKPLTNILGNCVYIQPSEWAKDVWVAKGFDNMPTKICPVGIETSRFAPINPREKRKIVMIYWKNRPELEIRFLEEYMMKNNISYKIIAPPYYDEQKDFIPLLHNSKYGIWLGSHESQGIALQETLSCDVPLIVWDVKLFSQATNTCEELCRCDGMYTTSVPYWDERCGEKFFNISEFEETHTKFLQKIDSYKPREFVEENLDLAKCAQNFINSLECIYTLEDLKRPV